VFAGYAFGQPMDLLFSLFEVMAVALSVGIVSLVALDGESNWMEGVQLLAVYIILGLAFYFLPAAVPVPVSYQSCGNATLLPPFDFVQDKL